MMVIRMIQMTPPSSTQPLVALLPMPLALNSRNTYWLATWARLAITSTSAATMAQPPNQPVFGTNARTATAGACSATAPTTNTRVAAMLYAGATDAVAMTVVEISPRAPDLR